MFIYTATPNEWEDIKTKKYFHDNRFHKEGFIHCSYPHQTLQVLNKHYKNDKTVILLVIDPEKLTSPWKLEDLKNKGESFPHVYGDINRDAVMETHKIHRGADGIFVQISYLTSTSPERAFTYKDPSSYMP